MTRDVVVTGIGLVSCAGEGVEAHLAALESGAAPRTNLETFAPFTVHPVVPLDLDRQIPKKSDQRQMEPWQRLGTYAAGLALDAANAKGDAALKSRMHLIVAAGGGERDYAVDGQILTGLRRAEKPGVFLNERLMGDLRPTLFLAQLSNLLAGNIAIVHGVTGASRTFMGEEAERGRRAQDRPGRASHRARTTSSSSAAPTTPSGPTCSSSTRWAASSGRSRSSPSSTGPHRAAA